MTRDVRSLFKRFLLDAIEWVRKELAAPSAAPSPFSANSFQGADWDTSDGKLKRFRAWLRERMGTSLVGDDLLEDYIDRAHAKGANRAFASLRRGKSDEPIQRLGLPGTSHGLPGQYGFVRGGVSRRATITKVKLLAGRTFTEMEDVTARMGTKMSRILADGLVMGKSPDAIAREIAAETDLSLERALLVARTELVRAHAEGQLDGLEESAAEYGEERGGIQVTAAVEYATAGDGRVCAACKPMEGAIFALEDARGLIPRHPNCRCAWVPVFREGKPVPLGKVRKGSGALRMPGAGKKPGLVKNAHRNGLRARPAPAAASSVPSAASAPAVPARHPLSEGHRMIAVPTASVPTPSPLFTFFLEEWERTMRMVDDEGGKTDAG